MVKVDLHTHTADDPVDWIPYSTRDLIDRAAAQGFGALAVTLHDRQLDIRPLAPYAAERGLVLIPGIERTIEGRHVLLLNFSNATEDVHSFADLARLKQREAGLVVAPHPYFPAQYSLFGRLTRHADLFDAVEYNAMYTASLNFNAPAERWARAHGKPIVGNGDVHRVAQLGATYSLVEADARPEAICAAIRAGRVRIETRPLSWRTAVGVVADMMAANVRLAPRRAPQPVRASL